MTVRVASDYPRVLVVGAASLSATGATGITLVNLFRGWPNAQIAQIYDCDTPPDPNVCANFKRFSSGDIPIVRAAQRLRHRRQGTSLSSTQSRSAVTSSTPANLFAALSDIAPLRVTKEILDWVAEFKPDVIYTVLGSVRIMNIVLNLSKQFDVPVVPHFMDDWPTTTYARRPLFILPKLVLKSKLHSILARTDVGLTIGDDMSDEFSMRYMKKFVSFMNCVEQQKMNTPTAPIGFQHVRFGYAGGLHLNRWQPLVAVAKALQNLKDDGVQVGLEIYAPPADIGTYRAHFSEYSVVETLATLHPSEIGEKLPALDVLLHVESFLHVDAEYTRLSVSTKIPQYMSSGRPILAHGPAALSSIRYVDKSRAGLIVTTENDVSALSVAAHALIRAPELRDKLGANGRRVAYERHDATMERSRFCSLLARAASSKGWR